MGTDLPTKVMLGQTLVLMQMTFLSNVRKVGDDIKALGIRRWRIKAQDRNEWTAIKREAKVKLKGP
jgi:hypothetical protein